MAIDVAKRCWYPVFVLLLNLSFLHAGERWSRQLTEFANVPGNDWVPLSRPGDRQAGAKVLNYFNSGPTFLDSADNNAQPQHHQYSFVNQQFPSQASRLVFSPQGAAQPLQQEFDSGFNQPFGNHQSFLQSPFGAVQSIQRHPTPQFNSQLTKDDLIHEKPSVLEQQPHQQQAFTFPALPQPQADKFPHSAEPSSQSHVPLQAQSNPGVTQEEVQLLYVPVETLYNQKPAQNVNRFNALPQPVSASLINDFYTAGTTTQKPRTTSTPYTTKATTKASIAAKLKPNQPPLAMFMYNDDRQSKLTISDALVNLKNLNQINVLDSLSKNLPKIFIGPSGLAPPKGYSKFDLPYLSNVEHKGADGRVDDLPFFVAPLSYKTPNGFTKIPLPSPHVGSVIVQQTTASSHSNNYYRQPENIEYYQPATLKFTESSTKSPITLPVSKPQYDTDHYSSPTFQPTTDRINYSRGSTQPPQESYRPPQTERALFSQAAFNSINNLPNRHVVNEEYFNLAKTRKPPTSSPTPNYSVKTYKPFEFKPIPEQKIPVFSDEEDQKAVYTTPRSTTTTTEKTHSSRLEDTRVKSYYKEENFRNRRPYSPPTVLPQYEEETDEEPAEITPPVRHSTNEDRFVHNFKLVDSVRPQTTQPPKSVIENAFLDFFQQNEREQPKTPAVTNNSPRGQQIIRNNYFATNDEQPKQKYVSTYYVPTVDTTTVRTTPPTTVITTTTTAAPETTASEDPFFKSFEEKSKLYEKEPPRYVQNSRPAQPSYTVDLRNQEPFLNQYTEPSYTNKYKYDTNTDGEVHYPVEVVTTQEPTRYETTSESQHSNPPSSDQSYNIPSELPPISANLPGLINSLMEDEWPNKKDEQVTTTTKSYFRKQTPRTSTQATPTDESYPTETTTRRSRGRRPTTSTTESVTPTRATTINRNRSRYVSANDERSVSRGRVRSRVQTTPRNPKQEENLDYQRDVLKQNYPAIRPMPLTTTNQPPTTTIASTTIATTLPVTYQQIYEEQTERLYPFLAPEAEPLPEEPKVEEVPIPKREQSFTEQVYQPEVTSVLPPSTHQEQQYFPAEQDDESVRVLPVSHAIEPQREISYIKPVEVQREQAVYVPRRRPVKQEEPLTTPAYRQEEEQDLTRKVEITPRPRRPLNRQPVYSPRTTTTTERVITERVTAEPTRGPQRRPAFARRPARPLYTTTPQPTTTFSSRGVTSDDEQPTQGTYTVRPKTRQDVLRGRTRRPVTTTTTTAPTDAPESTVTRGITRNKELRRISPTLRSRQEYTPQQPSSQQAIESTLSPRFRIRERSRFSLQPQETQWSTKLSQNSFQPVAESRSRSFDEKLSSIEPEPEIVTASALVQHEDDVQLINVSANLAGPAVPAGVITKEVALRQEPPQADENLEKGAPTFAELLNDVVKDFIDDSIQNNETESKTAEINELPVDEKPAVTEPQRNPVTQGRKNAINRNNFRKRGRSRYVVDSLETAESQHINTQHFFNSATFEPLKSIDKVNAPGKNVDNDPKGSSVIEEDVSVQQATTAVSTLNEVEDVTTQPETTTVAMVETTPAIETSSVLPTERENTTPLPTLEVQQDNDEPMSTEQVFYDSPDYQAEGAAENDHRHGIFADVKKQISDLFAMADNDPQTEEIEDEDTYRPMMMGYHAYERTSTLEPEVEGEVSTATVSTTTLPTTTTTLAPPSTTAIVTTSTEVSVTTTSGSSEETKPDPVTASAPQAMDAMAIPTSTSNGIMHETEICYRGRCVKTDKKKQKKNRFKPN